MNQANSSPAQGTYLPGTNIEIINPVIERGKIQFALFDFDRTLSMIREGWQRVMIPMMVRILREPDTGESEEELTELVTRLTGKQRMLREHTYDARADQLLKELGIAAPWSVETWV